MATSRQHGWDINKATVRNGLKPRREPYWRELEPRCYLGFRTSLVGGAGTWVARWTDEANEYQYKPLGSAANLEYADAKKAAEAWFVQCKGGVVRAGTVEEACRRYIADLQQRKGERLAKFPEGTFKATVYGTSFGRTPLDKLSTPAIREWVYSLVNEQRRAYSANKMLRTLKAALNLAFADGLTTTQPWKRVKGIEGEGAEAMPRIVFLTPAQRRALLAECDDDLANLIRGLLFTMARPYSHCELPAARVSDFDARQKTLRLVHSKGKGGAKARHVPLAPAAVEFFKELAKGKLPAAYLFTRGGVPWNRNWWRKGIAAAVAAANKKIENPAERVPTDTVAYTFRHCAIADRLSAGISIGKVAADSGTSVLMIEKHYGKFARENVEDRLATIVAY